MEKLPFDHKNENFFAACGLSEESFTQTLSNPHEAELSHLLRAVSIAAVLFITDVVQIPEEELSPIARVFRALVASSLAAFSTKSEAVEYVEKKILEAFDDSVALRTGLIKIVALLLEGGQYGDGETSL